MSALHKYPQQIWSISILSEITLSIQVQMSVVTFGLNSPPDSQHNLPNLVAWDHLLTFFSSEEDSKLFSGCEIRYGEGQAVRPAAE